MKWNRERIAVLLNPIETIVSPKHRPATADTLTTMSKSMSINEQANAYLRSRVMTAKPEELRLMLIEGAIRFTRTALEGLTTGDYELTYEGLSQCQPILLEMVNALDHSQDTELCDRLSALYSYLYRRTIDAGIEKDPAILNEVIELLQFERETWIMLMERLGAEQANAAGAADPIEGGPTLSIEG